MEIPIRTSISTAQIGPSFPAVDDIYFFVANFLSSPNMLARASTSAGVGSSLQSLSIANPVAFCRSLPLLLPDEQSTRKLPYSYASLSASSHIPAIALGTYEALSARSQLTRFHPSFFPSSPTRLLRPCDVHGTYHDLIAEIPTRKGHLRESSSSR